MRALFSAALFSVVLTTAAYADQSVAGKWHANLGGGVSIDMSVSPDGGWSSETIQKSKVVREMKGTYTQTPKADGSGVLVFTPTEESATTGKVQTETDAYELASNGKQLKLTSDGDTMVFHKRAQ